MTLRWAIFFPLFLLFSFVISRALPPRVLAEEEKAIPKKVFLLPVSGVIDLGLAPFTERVLQGAAKAGARAVILEISTPGGRVDAAIQMRDALLRSPVRTVAFVDREAFSAGALIALAADLLYMAPGAVIGAATPVGASGEKLGEKHVSAIRKLFRATAEARGKPPELAEAMVDEDVEVAGVIAKGKLLTLTTREALSLKVADGEAADLKDLLGKLGLERTVLVQSTPSLAERFVRFLTNPVVASLLLTVGFLGLLAELYTPGLGIAGGLGVTALALHFGGHYLVGLAGWEEALLILGGFALLAIEVFVLPGFGVAGVLGSLSLLAGLYLTFLGSFPTPEDLRRAGGSLGASVVLVLAGGLALTFLLPRTPLWARISLKRRLTEEAPLGGSEGGLLGQEGVAVTDLRPSGKVRFGECPVDVVSEGEFIPKDTPVRVVSATRYRVVVKPGDPEENGPDPSKKEETQ